VGAALKAPVIHNQIRERRLAIDGMTQEQLAKACGVTRQTIIALEAGKYSPSLELAFKLARALGRNLDDVFQYGDAI
jgi:putative transcriptional regulator